MTIRNGSNEKPFIDLRGPDGNVFVLIGYARSLARQLGWTEGLITPDTITTEMMSDDYEHAIKVFDAHFGDYVDLIR